MLSSDLCWFAKVLPSQHINGQFVPLTGSWTIGVFALIPLKSRILFPSV